MLWRGVFTTERRLGTLPMVILTPVVGAVSGTAWAVSHPSESVRNGVVVLARQSFGDVLLLALVGTVFGVLVVGGLVFFGALIWYRLSGDPIWTPGFRQDGERLGFSLHCTAHPPEPAASLGHVEARVKKPSGEVAEIPDSQIAEGSGGLWFRLSDSPYAPGSYEVRWYGTRGRRKLQEIAHATFETGGVQ